jgi:hypothetical protein
MNERHFNFWELGHTIADKFQTIEEKYGVAEGDDWLEVYMDSPFKREQRVEFVQGCTCRAGTVIDVAFGTFLGGEKRYDIQVQYDGKSIPRWTHPKWLKAAEGGAQ